VTIEVRNAALEEHETTLETREDDTEDHESNVKECEAAFEQCEDTAAEYDEPDTDVAMVKGIDHAINHAESQQEYLNIGIALAEACHKASLLVIAHAELCKESAIAKTSIDTHMLVDIIHTTSRFKALMETPGKNIHLAIKWLEALLEAIACTESYRETTFSEPATGADAIHTIYSAIACTETSRKALDSGVVIAEEAGDAVQCAIAIVDEYERAALVVKPVTAHAEHHMGITMTVDHAHGIAEELHVHTMASDDDEEVAATTNVLECLDGAIVHIDVKFGPVATLKVTTTCRISTLNDAQRQYPTILLCLKSTAVINGASIMSSSTVTAPRTIRPI
ncbi:hypothetical protein GGI13_005397, partial [Coemansia sp. RSA 455]